MLTDNAFADGTHNMWFSTSSNKIHLAWCNISPVGFEKGETILTLSFEVSDPTISVGHLEITMDDDFEFADVNGNIIDGIRLSIPSWLNNQTIVDGSSHQFILTDLSDNKAANGLISNINAFPNPFSTSTIISFSLTNDANVELTVYDIYGQTVGTLENNYLQAGEYIRKFNAEELPSGVYLYKFAVDGIVVKTDRLILNK